MDYQQKLKLAVGSCKSVSANSQDELRNLAIATSEIGDWTLALINDVNGNSQEIKEILGRLDGIERRVMAIENR